MNRSRRSLRLARSQGLLPAADWCRLIGRDCGGWGDFRVLLDWLCWGLVLIGKNRDSARRSTKSCTGRSTWNRCWRSRTTTWAPDVSESKARGWNPTGFYPTPHNVVECMVRMVMHDAGKDGRDPRTYSVCDPAVGSGRMLLHASNVSMALYGQDIDPLAVAMCKINGALFAPWMSFPLPAAIIGKHVPPPPTRLQPPELPSLDAPVYCVDGRDQGLLFPL